MSAILTLYLKELKNDKKKNEKLFFIQYFTFKSNHSSGVLKLFSKVVLESDIIE